MAERKVKVTLSAQVQGYVSAMEKAAQATRETGSEAEKLAQMREAFNTLGTAMVGVGAAVAAAGAAALKTGIDYNSMQQSSRAALLSMLGSTEAVNAQMDKLDDFARNSPFAKQTFIEAQQQMLAFGIETERVIPYLDAIQNAVAAAGGSNQDIAELAEIFGKISSSSKITAVDLQQFGRRGINAAELIGQAMGKTGAEIREEITAGTLDADAALEALASGMATRFSGAADNVKQTFDGAMDRVKAAWRDFSSELARPLVDPEGGGALVDFLNGLADAMRGFENLPDPVKEAALSMTGLVGAVSLVGGTAVLAVPKVAKFKETLAGLDMTAGSAAGAIGKVSLVLATIPAAKALVDWLDGIREVTVASDDLESQFRRVGVASSDLKRGLTGGSGFRGLGIDAELAANNLRTLNTWIGGLKAEFDNSMLGTIMSAPFLGLGREAGNAQKQIEELDAAMAGMVVSGDTDSAAEAFEYFAEMAKDAGWSTERIAEALPEYTQAVKDAEAATDDNIQSLEELAGAAQSTSDEVGSLADEIRNFGSAQMDAEEAAIKFHEELETLNKRVAEGATGLDVNTQAGRDNRQSLLDMAAATNDSAAATFAATGEQSALNSRLEQGRTALYNAAIQFGMTEAEAKAYADQLIATPESIQTYVKLNGIAEASMAIDTFVARHNGRAITIHVRQDGASTRQLLNEGADGFIEEYARGGLEEYAAGGFSPGIYRGGAPIHKFAEHETMWEAYISGKPSERDRNRQIWVEAGDRLGMGDVLKAVQAAAPSPGLSGPVRLVVGDREFDAYVDERADGRVARGLSPLSRGRQRSVLGRG